MPELFGEHCHPVVVGNEPPEVSGQALRRGQVDGVERSQLDREQGPGEREHPVIDPDELQAGQHPTASGERLVAAGYKCPKNLSSSQTA